MNGAVHGQGARGERSRVTGVPRKPVAGARQPPADHDHAGKAQRQHEEEPGEERDEGRRLELEAPAQLLAARAQPDQRSRDDRERREHAGGVREAVSAKRPEPPARMLDEPERLDRENGQHAGHQVQHEPTSDGQSQRSEQRDERCLTGFADQSR